MRGLRLGLSLGSSRGTSVPVAPSAPSNLVAPALSGELGYIAGQSLASSTGTWSGSPTAYEYKWQKDGVDISGATASSRVTQSTDHGGILKSLVRAQNAAGWSSWVECSNPKYAIDTALFLDASDTSTITQTAGSVSAWNDKSGAGNTFIQPTGSDQPTTGVATLNGNNAISYDGSTDHLYNTSGSVLSLGTGTVMTIVVAKKLSTLTNHPFVTLRDGSGNLHAIWSYGVYIDALNCAYANRTGGLPPADTNTNIYAVRRDGTTLEARFNSSIIGSNTNGVNIGTGSYVRIGRDDTQNRYAQMYLGCVISITKTMTSSMISQLYADLKTKWGTA